MSTKPVFRAVLRAAEQQLVLSSGLLLEDAWTLLESSLRKEIAVFIRARLPAGAQVRGAGATLGRVKSNGGELQPGNCSCPQP